jgi:Iap family predicted aminopeptidase
MRRVVLLVATLFGVLFFAFGTLVGCALLNSAMKPSEVAKAVTPEIDEASVRRHLKHLTGEAPVSLEGSEETTISERGSEKGRKAAAEYMEASFEEVGVPARILSFPSASGAERGYNVEATLMGSVGEKHLWVTAHLDSVGNAGANDNASGLVLLLLTARALEGLDLEHTVHFVAYDLEEVGLIGSTRFVHTEVLSVRDQEGEEAIIGNINADMIGYEQNQFNAFVETCDQAGSLDEALTKASRAIDPPLTLTEGCPQRIAGRSDHVPFRDAGLPAVVLVDGAKFDDYPCYHKPCDTADKVNVTYLRTMIRLVATASALLGAPEPRP